VYRVKRIANPADMNIPAPDPSDDISNYDWINDPNGYFEDANFADYMLNADAIESTSGTSWDYPYKTLQDAFARAIKANSGINEIWLTSGTYTPNENESFKIDKNIKIYGGFVGNEADTDERSNVANKTIMTPSDENHSVFWLSTENAIKTYLFDGLTIKGSANNGIYLRRNTLDIQHCVISGNGCGIAGNNASLSIQDSVFTYNDLGLDMSFSGILIDRCIFSFNNDLAIKMNNNGVLISNSVVSENSGNGLQFISPLITEIYNCDIINNAGYCLYGLSGNATTRIRNCIVYGNNNNTLPTGQSIGQNVQTDPPFWFPYVQDSNYVRYQLSPNANTCIDLGNNGAVCEYPLDLYGQERIVNSTVDIGAVESLPVSNCDFNLDTVVNFLDFSEFAQVWQIGSSNPNYAVKYDLDTDGFIDIQDLYFIGNQWLFGSVSTGSVTSTYQVDFGYRVPDTGMMLMSSLSSVESESSIFSLDGTSLETMEIQEAYSNVDDMSVEERFEIAKSKLGISELAIEETGSQSIVPKINLIKQEREQELEQVQDPNALLDWLDEVWQNNSEMRNSMTETEYLEFRDSVQQSN
jgi:hypothetical protein